MNVARRFIAGLGLLAMLALGGPAWLAQDDPATPAEPATPAAPADEDQPAVVEQVDEKKKRHFGLYLSAAGGNGSADEVNTSLAADSINFSDARFEMDDVQFGSAAIGWQLPEGKGDFRIRFQGFNEQGHQFRGTGSQNQTETSQANDAIPWWFIQGGGGTFTAQKFIPMWEETEYLKDMDGNIIFDDDGNCIVVAPGDDINCDNLPDRIEVRYDFTSPDATVISQLAEDQQNELLTYDFIYGRTFGGRRYSSQWFGGLRYFVYEGNLPAAAWLNLNTPGVGFTDGGFLRLLNLSQETTGFGPYGSWEAAFNFLNQGVQLYLVGEVAFTFNSMTLDSGPFFQIDIVPNAPDVLAEDRIFKSLDKSTWQNGVEAGVRVNLKNGLKFWASYGIKGFLDVVITPDLLQLGVVNTDPQTSTQDLVFDVGQVGVGFQF